MSHDQQVDAHADLNPPLASGSGNIHGMVMAFLLQETQEYIPYVDAFKWLKPWYVVSICITAVCPKALVGSVHLYYSSVS